MLGTGCAKHTFFMDDTFSLTTMELEGKQLPVPRNTDAYLTNVYGNWRQLPSDELIIKSLHCQEYVDEIFENKNKAIV